MNNQTLIENAHHYATTKTKRLTDLNRQQADRLSQGGDVLLDWSQMRRRATAQAKAMIAADLQNVLDRVTRDDPTAEDVIADAVRKYVMRSLTWIRTPSSTDAMSNVMDAILNDARLDLARELCII